MEESDILLIRIFESKKFIQANLISSLEACTSEIFQRILIGFLKISQVDVKELENSNFHQKFKVANKISDLVKGFGIKCPVTTIVAPTANEVRTICSQIVGNLPEEKSNLENFESVEEAQKKEKTFSRQKQIEKFRSQNWIHPMLQDKPKAKSQNFPFIISTNSLKAKTLSNKGQNFFLRIMQMAQKNSQLKITNRSKDESYLMSEASLKISNAKILSKEWQEIKEEIVSRRIHRLSTFHHNDYAANSTIPSKSKEEEVQIGNYDSQKKTEEEKAKLVPTKEEIEALREEFESKKGELHDLHSESHQKQYQIADFENQLNILKTQLVELNKQATIKMSELKALSDDTHSKELQREVSALKEELVQMEDTLKKAENELKDQISLSKKTLEKLDLESETRKMKLKELSSETDSMTLELRNGEKLIERLKEEWEKIPKEISRSVFVKKIKDIQGNLGKQRHIFAQIQSELESLSKTLKSNESALNRQYIEFENSILSKDPKRSDLLFSRIFAVYNEFKISYSKTVSNLEVQEKLKKEVQSIEVQTEILKTKKFEEKLEQLRAEIQSSM